jgi:hypothetical protein
MVARWNAATSNSAPASGISSRETAATGRSLRPLVSSPGLELLFGAFLTGLVLVCVPAILRNALHLTHRPAVGCTAVHIVELHLFLDPIKVRVSAVHKATFLVWIVVPKPLPCVTGGNGIVGVLEQSALVGGVDRLEIWGRHVGIQNGVSVRRQSVFYHGATLLREFSHTKRRTLP